MARARSWAKPSLDHPPGALLIFLGLCLTPSFINDAEGGWEVQQAPQCCMKILLNFPMSPPRVHILLSVWALCLRDRFSSSAGSTVEHPDQLIGQVSAPGVGQPLLKFRADLLKNSRDAGMGFYCPKQPDPGELQVREGGGL